MAVAQGARIWVPFLTTVSAGSVAAGRMFSSGTVNGDPTRGTVFSATVRVTSVGSLIRDSAFPKGIW